MAILLTVYLCSRLDTEVSGKRAMPIMPSALRAYSECVDSYGQDPIDEQVQWYLTLAARMVVRDHGVAQHWQAIRRHYDRLIVAGSSLNYDDSAARRFAELYLKLWNEWQIDLKGVAEDFELESLRQASECLCPGLKRIPVRALRIAEADELMQLVGREAPSVLRHELLQVTVVMTDGREVSKSDPRFDEWVHTSHARYLPGKDEIHLSRKLVGLSFDSPKLGNPWLEPEKDLVPTLAHELTHALQFKEGPSNLILKRYETHRHSLPPKEQEAAAEWARRYYRPEFWLAEEMAKMSEDRRFWDQPAFNGFAP